MKILEFAIKMKDSHDHTNYIPFIFLNINILFWPGVHVKKNIVKNYVTNFYNLSFDIFYVQIVQSF